MNFILTFSAVIQNKGRRNEKLRFVRHEVRGMNLERHRRPRRTIYRKEGLGRSFINKHKGTNGAKT